jgi:3-hydroxypropanoate dehydrogenase
MTQSPDTRPDTQLAVVPIDALNAMLLQARSQNGWLDRPVSEQQLRAIYDISRWGPTSMNTQPQRIVFLQTPAAKARLLPAMAPGNVAKVTAAPVVAILAYDLKFFERLPVLFPHNQAAKAYFDGPDKAQHAETTAFRNATLQGAYFIMAARAIGLDCGPMSGFNNAKVDEEFFAGTQLRTNFVCCLGYGDASKIMPRLPRLSFDQACTLL